MWGGSAGGGRQCFEEEGACGAGERLEGAGAEAGGRGSGYGAREGGEPALGVAVAKDAFEAEDGDIVDAGVEGGAEVQRELGGGGVGGLVAEHAGAGEADGGVGAVAEVRVKVTQQAPVDVAGVGRGEQAAGVAGEHRAVGHDAGEWPVDVHPGGACDALPEVVAVSEIMGGGGQCDAQGGDVEAVELGAQIPEQGVCGGEVERPVRTRKV